jgi:hypothetical protein
MSVLLNERAVSAGLVQLSIGTPLWRIPMGMMYHEHNEELSPVKSLLDVQAG